MYEDLWFPICCSSICSYDDFFFLFDCVWMFIFWEEWKSTGNKYSLIESFPPLFHFCSDLCSRSHTVPSGFFFFFFYPLAVERPVQDYYRIIWIIWQTWAETFFFLFLEHLCLVSLPLCHRTALSPLPILCAVLWFWWQGSSSQLGRWVSNQSGLSRGASAWRTHSLIASRQAGERLQSLQHMLTGAGAAVLAAPPPKACKSLS